MINVASILNGWQQVNRNTFAVIIDTETILGESALMYFHRRIPRDIREKFASLRWDGDFQQDHVRWGRIRVTWRKEEES